MKLRANLRATSRDISFSRCSSRFGHLGLVRDTRYRNCGFFSKRSQDLRICCVYFSTNPVVETFTAGFGSRLRCLILRTPNNRPQLFRSRLISTQEQQRKLHLFQIIIEYVNSSTSPSTPPQNQPVKSQSTFPSTLCVSPPSFFSINPSPISISNKTSQLLPQLPHPKVSRNSSPN